VTRGRRASAPSEDDLAELENYVVGIYDELDKLSRKSPGHPLSDLAVRRVNRAISDARDLMGAHDKYVTDLEPFVPAGENPEVRDAVLVLRDIKQAIGRVEKKHGLGEWSDDY